MELYLHSTIRRPRLHAHLVIREKLPKYLSKRIVFRTDFADESKVYCTVLAVLVRLQTSPLNYSHSFIRRLYSSVVQSLSHKQTVLSLTVLTIHPFCRLSSPSTISVGARLFTVDSRLSLSLLSPTAPSTL
jgi:hypothetical protein